MHVLLTIDYSRLVSKTVTLSKDVNIHGAQPILYNQLSICRQIWMIKIILYFTAQKWFKIKLHITGYHFDKMSPQ